MIAPGSPVSFKAWVDSPFFLVAEIFTNLANGDVASLTNSAKFQNNVPDLRFYLSRFYWRSSERLPTAGLDNYGSRISGWFTPPSNGLYRFFLASDDGGQLFLNTNETDSASPAGKVLIARNDGARSYYTNNDASMSANLWLNGGQKYYIETLQKEGAGDDYVAVAFRGVPDEVAIPAMPPGIVPSVESIGGANLSTYADTLAASLNVTAAPEAALSVNENDLLTLRVRAQALPVGTPLFYVWERYDAGSGLWSPAGSSSNLSFYVPLSDDQAQYRVTLYTVGQQRRYTTTLAVATDVEPPWIESAGSLDGSTIVVKFNERVMPNVAGEGINWQVTAEDGSWPAVEPSIRVDRVVGVERISYDQVILKVTPPVTGTFQVSAFSMADWAANGNATGQSDAFGTVAGLTAQDIGTAGADPVVPGGALSFASNTVDVAAAGSDIWNAADGFQYVYRRVAGNFDIKVRVASVAAANVWSKAGLMARPLASGNSRYIAMLATPPDGQNTFTFQWRDTDGAACGSLNSAAAVAPFNTPPTYPNTWLRLTRAGSVISGFTGTNGTDWILFTNRDTALFGGAYPSSPILVGMAVTAHVNTGSNAMTLAEFRDLYFPALPVITRQPGPASLASPIHQRVDYSVAATSGADAGPLTYQWQKDGINIPGATGPALSLLNPAVTDSGSYTVVVGNNGGGAVSDAAVLMVVNELPAAVTDLIATNDCSFAFPAATLTANDTDPEGDPLAVTGVSGIEPASFAANFNDGLLPAGTALFGNAIVTASGGVSDSGCLRLTEAVTNQMGAFLINDIIPGRWLGAFTAQFMIRVGGGSAVAADGLSFNVAANLVAAAVAAAEEGVGSGLSVCLDNYDNGGGEAPALDVKVGGIVVGHVPIAKVSSTRWLQMSVELKNGGLVTVRLDGTNVFADLPTAFAPLAQARFGFYARTGGEYETHWLDDVRITVFSADTVAGGRVELVGGTVRYTNPAGGCGLDEFYYLVSDGQIDGTVSCRVAIQHPPLARNDQMSAVTAAPSVVSLSKLRANDLNQDGQALAFAFTQPAHGAVTIVDDAVTYTSLPGFTGRDSWTYSIQDSRYPASVAVVSVVVADPLPGPTVNVAASGVRNNQFWSRFAGIPGKTYRIETATDVVHGPWTLVTEASAGRNGQFEVTDTVHDPAAGQRFYRAVSALKTQRPPERGGRDFLTSGEAGQAGFPASCVWRNGPGSGRHGGRGLLEVPVRPELGVPQPQPLRPGEGLQFFQGADEGRPQGRGRRGRIVMGPAEGFGDDLVAQTHPGQILGGDLESFGRLGGGGAITPQDGGAAFGADDRIIGVLEHEHPVGHANAQRAARTALAQDRRDDGHLQQKHLAQVDGDGLGDVAFLGADAGVGPGRVDQGDDRQVELVGQAHQAQRLAVAFGVGGAKVAANVLLGVAAFLGAQDHNGAVAQLGKAAHQRLVVGIKPVAMQLAELAKGRLDVIQGVRPLGMAGQLDPLPGSQVRVNLLARFLDLLLDLGYFVINVQ